MNCCKGSHPTTFSQDFWNLLSGPFVGTSFRNMLSQPPLLTYSAGAEARPWEMIASFHMMATATEGLQIKNDSE